VLGYLAPVLGSGTATVLFALAGAPLLARLSVPLTYVVLVTVGTRAWGWAAFGAAMIVAGLGVAGVFAFRPIDPAQCDGWNRPLSTSELSRLHTPTGTTVAELFTRQASGDAQTGFKQWRQEGGNC